MDEYFNIEVAREKESTFVRIIPPLGTLQRSLVIESIGEDIDDGASYTVASETGSSYSLISPRTFDNEDAETKAWKVAFKIEKILEGLGKTSTIGSNLRQLDSHKI